MVFFGRWLGLTGVCLSLIGACSSDDSGKAGDGKSWQCDRSTDVVACTCTYDSSSLKYANPVDECSAAIGAGVQCCRSPADAMYPMCTCIAAACSAGWTEVYKCSGLPPP